jgi:hypothetical protein
MGVRNGPSEENAKARKERNRERTTGTTLFASFACYAFSRSLSEAFPHRSYWEAPNKKTPARASFPSRLQTLVA